MTTLKVGRTPSGTPFATTNKTEAEWRTEVAELNQEVGLLRAEKNQLEIELEDTKQRLNVALDENSTQLRTTLPKLCVCESVSE